jgi:hypothetical protein
MLPKVGQRVRVFGLVSDSWVIAKVLGIEGIESEPEIKVIVEDWVGFPRNFTATVSYKKIELISSGI